MLEPRGVVLTLWLNRPEVRNAFDDRLLDELCAALTHIAGDESVRVLVVTGRGSSFCAGADLSWMQKTVDYEFEENLRDAAMISEVFSRLYSLRIPTVAAVNGPAIGGGMGFVGACDLVVSAPDAVFGLSEVRLGLIPACIGPFILRRAPGGRIRRYLLTGERFSPDVARELGLVDVIAPSGQVLDEAYRLADAFLNGAPGAQALAKEMLERVPGMPLADSVPYTVEMIARLRAGPEAQRGMRCFLGKEPLSWRTGRADTE